MGVFWYYAKQSTVQFLVRGIEVVLLEILKY